MKIYKSISLYLYYSIRKKHERIRKMFEKGQTCKLMKLILIKRFQKKKKLYTK